MIGEVAQSVPVNKNSEKEKLLGSKFPGFYFCMDEPEVLNYKQIIFYIYIYIYHKGRSKHEFSHTMEITLSL